MDILKHLFTFVAATLVAWFTLGIVIGYAYISLTMMGECSYDEVECNAASEFVASEPVGYGIFALLVGGSVGIGWIFARRRAKRLRGR